MKLLHRGYLASVALAVVILPMMVLGAEATEGIQYPLYHQLTFSCRLDTVKVSNEYLASISSKGETTFKEEAGLGDIQELLKKLMPGDKVRVTHSIWPRNPGNGTNAVQYPLTIYTSLNVG